MKSTTLGHATRVNAECRMPRAIDDNPTDEPLSVSVPGRVGRLLLRTAFLLLGASIFLAFMVVEVSMLALARQRLQLPYPVLVVLAAAPLLALGLVPGVRELEVSAARSMLQVTGELISPRQLSRHHRVRAALWTFFHLLLGGLAGAILLIGIPSVITIAIEWSNTGGPDSLLGWSAPGWASQNAPVSAALMLGGILCCLAATIGAGLAARQLAAMLLGPSWRDRVLLAELRLQTETQQRRLARELHDGIGHALSMISLQAAAGGRTLRRDPDQAAAAIQTIETVSRQAQEDLDHMLAFLRDARASRAPEPSLDDVHTLAAMHRSLGMDLDVSIEMTQRLPMLAATTAYKIISESLTNAHRYAAAGRIAVLASTVEGELVIMISSPLRRAVMRRRGGGRGLRGLTERAALFGGVVTAGPNAGSWVVEARIPL